MPRSIATEEILPKVQDDPDYLVEHQFQVVDGWAHNSPIVDPYLVNWDDVESNELSYRFRQTPGNSNALGRIKFIFPNEHSVYLHDAPSKSLFSRKKRAFSHDCNRFKHLLDLQKFFSRQMFNWKKTTSSNPCKPGTLISRSSKTDPCSHRPSHRMDGRTRGDKFPTRCIWPRHATRKDSVQFRYLI